MLLQALHTILIILVHFSFIYVTIPGSQKRYRADRWYTVFAVRTTPGDDYETEITPGDGLLRVLLFLSPREGFVWLGGT